MEHLIIEDYKPGYKRIKPEEGYRILDKRNSQLYSSVICKENNLKYFSAYKI